MPIRITTWNIEKGKRWQLLEQCLSHESIRSADILCLNEVDEGMARSGNLRIADEIGKRLGMQVVFGQTFKELTKGSGDELRAPGENTAAVQGNAILSRLPILDSENLLLPACFDHSKRLERRNGNRHALIVRTDCGAGRSLTIANAHLEVFGTAACRGVQMKFLLDRLPAGPAVVTGDFNTNTFSRGSALHTCHALALLALTEVESRALTPWNYEPLFKHLSTAGFSWESFNDKQPTCSADLASLDERTRVPSVIRKLILSRYRVLPLRLDFICCRGLQAVSQGSTIRDLPWQPSDHLPITCDVSL
jgi:endonuclease/exonuclease/phosphatase family metal-dependent hydrolase